MKTLIESYNDVSSLQYAFELRGLTETDNLKSFYEFTNLSNYNIIVPSNSLNTIDSSTKLKLFDKPELLSTDMNIIQLSFYIGNRVLNFSHNIFDAICANIGKAHASNGHSVESSIIMNTIHPFYDKLSIMSNTLNAVNLNIYFNIADTNTRNNVIKYLNSTFNYISDVLNNSYIPQMYNKVKVS